MRPLELLRLGRLLNSFTDDDEEVLRQDKGDTLPLVPELLLLVIQEVTKVNVEELQEEEELVEAPDSAGGGVWRSSSPVRSPSP